MDRCSTSNLGESPSRVINLVLTFSAQSNRAVEGNLVSPFRYARSGDNRLIPRIPVLTRLEYVRATFRRSYVDKHGNKPIRPRVRSHSHIFGVHPMSLVMFHQWLVRAQHLYFYGPVWRSSQRLRLRTVHALQHGAGGARNRGFAGSSSFRLFFSSFCASIFETAPATVSNAP